MLGQAGVVGFIDTLPVIKKAHVKSPLVFPNPLLLTSSGVPSFSQTSLFSACKGEIAQGAHQAHHDVKNLISILETDSIKKVFQIPLQHQGFACLLSSTLPKEPRKRKQPQACPECGAKRHVASNPCSKNKKSVKE